MSEKIKVEVCVGTTCFILGADELQDLADKLPADLQDKVEVVGTTCLGYCKNDNYGSAPFVRVGGELVSMANVNSVALKIRQQLEKK